MNYYKIYLDLVNEARNQKISDSTYVERHHIIPKSLGGTNDAFNLVKFTGRQHYVAHELLVMNYKQKMLNGEDKTPYFKMLRALTAMVQLPASKDQNGLRKRLFKFNSKLYEKWKTELAIENFIASKKRIKDLKENHPEKFQEINEKISKSVKLHIQKYGSPWQGRNHSESSKRKIKEFHDKFHPQAGEKNSQYGTIAIYNEETFERATQPKDQPILEGWVKGRFYSATPEELKERKKLVEEILKLDPNSKVSIRMKLQKLQRIHEKILNPNLYVENENTDSELKRFQREQQIREKTELLTKQYEFYNEYGWNKFVNEFDYQYSYPNFVQQCKKYVKNFIPQNGKKRGKK